MLANQRGELMIWPNWEPKRQMLMNALKHHSKIVQPLPGIALPGPLDVLGSQLVASLRRERYFEVIKQRPDIPAERADPNDPSFEAELGVVHLLQTGQIDEAAWLIFLMTYFGKPYPEGWLLLRQVYGSLGAGTLTWASIAASPAAFETWQNSNWKKLTGKYGSHRKYESNRPTANRPLANAVKQYVALVTCHGDHTSWFASLVRKGGNDPHRIFDAAYSGINIRGFGRLGRFDYVSMVGRYGLLPAAAGSAYLDNATGPKRGAKLLFGGNVEAALDPQTLQQKLNRLDADLEVGMQVLEDALCNWQKRPDRFEHFKG